MNQTLVSATTTITPFDSPSPTLSEDAAAAPDTPKAPSAKPKWRKARPVVLTPKTTAEVALMRVIASGVRHMHGNEACILARAHDEGVHQMRVAVRRLRSSLAIYRDILPRSQSGYLDTELRWLIGELGPARDWDVFLAETLPPVEESLPGEAMLRTLRGHAERMRDAGYERAQAAIQSHRYVGLGMLLATWGEGRGWRSSEEADVMENLGRHAVELARSLLDVRCQAVKAHGVPLVELDAKERHRVRIEVKKLRYATDFFGSLYSRRLVRPFEASLKTLQDVLGVANDRVVARRLLRSITRTLKGKERARMRYASGLVVGWHAHIADDHERQVERAWQTFEARQPFWQPKASKAAVMDPTESTGEEPAPEVDTATATDDVWQTDPAPAVEPLASEPIRETVAPPYPQESGLNGVRVAGQSV